MTILWIAAFALMGLMVSASVVGLISPKSMNLKSRGEAFRAFTASTLILAFLIWLFDPFSQEDATALPKQPDEASGVAERPQLSAKERYNLMMVDPDRARAIREAKDHKALALFFREIEKASATALQYTDAKEFKIQETYSSIALMRSGQIPDPDGKAGDCVSAAGDLNVYLITVLGSYSAARTAAELAEASAQWRKSMAACERAVGLKPSERFL